MSPGGVGAAASTCPTMHHAGSRWRAARRRSSVQKVRTFQHFHCSSRFHGHCKNVSHPALRPNQLRLTWICLELSAQPENLDINAAIEHLVIVHPARSEELLAAEHALWRLQEGHQQIELAPR